MQQQNLALQHRQSDLEKEYRTKLESIQLDNRRQMERLETAAAFRVRAFANTSALNKIPIALPGHRLCGGVCPSCWITSKRPLGRMRLPHLPRMHPCVPRRKARP